MTDIRKLQKPVLAVEADGPLSVRCETCGEHITGTTYPDVKVYLERLLSLFVNHARECKKGAA